MGLKIDQINFDGIQGTLNRPSPVFEPIYKLGGSKVYMQRLRTESKQQTATLWCVFPTHAACAAHVVTVKNVKGLKKTCVYEGTETFTAFYLLDYTYTIKAKAGSKFILEYEITFLIDEEEEQQVATNEVDLGGIQFQ